MRPISAFIASGLVLTLAGCGESDQERIQQVVRDYARASTTGDAETACGLTAPEMFADVPGSTCEDFVRHNSRPGGYGQQAGRRQAAGEYVVEIDGDRATAEGHNLGIFGLRRIDGEWKLTSVR
jgi:hypothetical protein